MADLAQNDLKKIEGQNREGLIKTLGDGNDPYLNCMGRKIVHTIRSPRKIFLWIMKQIIIKNKFNIQRTYCIYIIYSILLLAMLCV